MGKYQGVVRLTGITHEKKIIARPIIDKLKGQGTSHTNNIKNKTQLTLCTSSLLCSIRGGSKTNGWEGGTFGGLTREVNWAGLIQASPWLDPAFCGVWALQRLQQFVPALAVPSETHPARPPCKYYQEGANPRCDYRTVRGTPQGEQENITFARLRRMVSEAPGSFKTLSQTSRRTRTHSKRTPFQDANRICSRESGRRLMCERISYLAS